MLRANPIDLLLWQLGRLTSPFQLWGIGDFDEALDGGTLERAVDLLLCSIPVLRCRLEVGFLSARFVPIPGLTGAQVVEKRSANDPEEMERLTSEIIAKRLDAKRGPNIALRAIAGTHGTRLVLLIHHALVDGRAFVPRGTQRPKLQKNGQSADAFLPRAQKIVFPPAQFCRIAKAGRAAGATVNDVLLATLIVVSSKWNEERRSPPSTSPCKLNHR